MELKLTADNENEERVLDYLRGNVSESLAERINAGSKTLADCWKFITDEARKRAKGGCACIEDTEVYGWAIHFFEEDGIAVKASEKKAQKPQKKNIQTKSKTKTERETSKAKPKFEQLSLFDMV